MVQVGISVYFYAVIVTESFLIPSKIITRQTYALLMNNFYSKAAVASVLVSTSIVAFTNTMVYYDFDSDPEMHKYHPEFYGYFGCTSRQRLWTFRFLMSLVLLYDGNEKSYIRNDAQNEQHCPRDVYWD